MSTAVYTLRRRLVKIKTKHLHRDRGYRFTDRDPVLEEITDLITKSGKSVHEISQLTAKYSGGVTRVAENTITAWLNGKTKLPRNLTISWVAFAIGYQRKFVLR